MINLMTNEREMLQSSSISNLFGTISTITNDLNIANRSKLQNKILLGKKAIEFKAWLKSAEANQVFENADLCKWSLEEMSLKVFSVKQSQLNRMIKASKNQDKLDQFLTKCNQEEAEGNKVIRSVDNFNKFCKGLLETNEEEVNATIPTIFTLSFKRKSLDENAERNIALRINESLEVITKNDSEEIKLAIAFLNQRLESNAAADSLEDRVLALRDSSLLETSNLS